MKVILHKLFPYAPYLNEYIGFEKDISDDGDPLEEVETLRKLAEQSHRERYPHLYPNGSEAMVESFTLPIQQIQKPIERTRDKSLKADPDIIILKKYDNAVRARDEKTKKEIEDNYNII